MLQPIQEVYSRHISHDRGRRTSNNGPFQAKRTESALLERILWTRPAAKSGIAPFDVEIPVA